MNFLQAQSMVNELPPAKRQFLQWLKNANPALYRKAMSEAAQKMASQMHGMGQTSTTSTTSSFWDSLTGTLKSIGTAASTIVPTILNAQTNQKILDTQLKLAQAGKPPLNTSQITTPPTATVSVGTSKAVTYAMYGGLALLGIFLVSKMAKR